MLIAYRSLLFVKALLSSCKISSCNFACVSAFPRLSTPFNVTAKYRFYARFCAMAEPNATTRLGSDTQRTYQVVVAATRDMGIGKDGKLPWRLPSDLKFFKELTMATSDPGKKNAVVMGRKTWESIPPEYRPLRGRLNVVLTRSGTGNYCVENVVTCRSIPLALQLLAKDPYCLSIEKVFVIGGGQILREALNAPGCDAIYITEIETSIECDTFIPSIDFSLFYLGYSSPPIVENNIRFSFVTYIRVRNSVSGTNAVSSEVKFNGRSDSNKFEVEKFKFLPNMIFQRHDEYRYMRMVQEIISSGTEIDDRTRTGSVSKFGCQRMFWEGVVEELLWLISGSTNAKVLEERGIHIWDGNASRGYVDSNGLAEREDDDLGDPYMDFRGDILVPGFDQLSDVIDKIKH